MLRVLTDENLDGRILRGMLLRLPDLDFARVQDVGLIGAPDPDILEWAAVEGRVLLTHDVRTMTQHARERLAAGQSLAGVVLVSRHLPLGPVIEDLLILIEGSDPNEMAGQVLFLPL